MINYKSNNKKGYEQMHLRMNVTFLWLFKRNNLQLQDFGRKMMGKEKKCQVSSSKKTNVTPCLEDLVSSLVYESHQNIVKGIKTVLCS